VRPGNVSTDLWESETPLNSTAATLMACIPFAIMAAAAILRLIAAAQPETSWSGFRRHLLCLISYALGAIAVCGMVLLVFTAGPAGAIGLLVTLFLAFLLIDAEIRIAGARNRARQAELLWVLAIAVKSGRPLAEEIEAHAKGSWGKRHRLLTGLARRLREGVPLTEIVVPQGLLPRSAAMQIHSGITSGSLEESLHNTAVRFTANLAEDQDSANPGAALIYPAALIPVASAILAFLMIYIMPKLKKIFADFDTELPGPTVALITLSDLIVNFWVVLGLPLFYVPVGIFVIVGLAEYHGWHVFLQSIFGRWFVRWHTPDIVRALSQSVAKGIPLDRALTPIIGHPGPRRLHNRLTMVVNQINGGAESWQSLQNNGFLKPHETVVLEMAQRSGNLPWALDAIASSIERRAAFRLRVTLEFLRPMLIVAISLVFGFIAFALFIPLVKLLIDLS
jgi:type II secretory pathway component PulF